jgi:hypothetical protein
MSDTGNGGSGTGGDGIHRGTDTTSGASKVPLDDGSKAGAPSTKATPAADKAPAKP